MEHARVITLTPDTIVSNVASFEEAFGEHSEARGRGRARRDKRKRDRQGKKIERRRTRKKTRQEMRAEQQQARMQKKDVRKIRKVARKEMGEKPERDEEDYNSSPMPVSSRRPPTPIYENENEEYDTADEGSYDDDSDYDTPYQEDNDDPLYDEENDYYFDSSFDGVMGAEDRYNELADDSSPINPDVEKITGKLEWNRTLLVILNGIKEGNKSKGLPTTELDNKILLVTSRIDALRKSLEKYVAYDGEFSGADGTEYSEARGRKRSPKAKKAKRKEVAKGRRLAIKSKRNARKAKECDGGGATEVDSNLNPELSEQRIEIPADEENYFTGLNGIDLVDDFDAPQTREFEISSNATGKTKKINWTGVLIGVGVAAVIIFAIKKSNILSK